ncbi:MAG: RHS repeat-associated core domain-containing protein [Pseudomonas sp.]|jgi:RHS repeat-associated protein|nr:RHS repeat-associated core domain-containing protein [Pseudomonas sp.]
MEFDNQIVRQKRFYQGGKLRTVLDGATSTSHVHALKQSLAEVKRSVEARSVLALAVDSQGSILSNASGGTRSYTPYGNLSVSSAGSPSLAFNGEYKEWFTQHYLLGNGHRAYSTALRRFISPDRLSPFGKGGVNSYVYCQGDPVNFSDPSGQFRFARCFSCFGRAFSAKFSRRGARGNVRPSNDVGLIEHPVANNRVTIANNSMSVTRRVPDLSSESERVFSSGQGMNKKYLIGKELYSAQGQKSARSTLHVMKQLVRGELHSVTVGSEVALNDIQVLDGVMKDFEQYPNLGEVLQGTIDISYESVLNGLKRRAGEVQVLSGRPERPSPERPSRDMKRVRHSI